MSIIGQLYNITDNELLPRIANGDRHSFTILYNRYGNNLLRFVSGICLSKEVAEEIVQELFIKVWLSREDLIDIKDIKPYLYRAAKNLLLNYIRTLQKEAKVMDNFRSKESQLPADSDYEMIYSECYQIAQTAVDLLPAKRKIIFKMRHNDELSLDEIAQRLSISKSVVKKQLYSGIHFVKAYLYKHGNIMFLFALYLHLLK